MTKKNYDSYTVGQIVADNFNTTKVFARYHIDFCCHGNVLFAEACQNSNVEPETVARELDELQNHSASNTHDFASWPLDLLLDYVLKIHHRNIRAIGPQIAELLDKVVTAHAEKHPELLQVQKLFHDSLNDLSSHLLKEENVLFPYLYKLFNASTSGTKIERFHCDTIRHPINAMELEHSGEGERYDTISKLTNGFTAPEDACASYRLVLQQLQQFETALHEHIHLENNMIFPHALQLETSICN